VQDKMLRVLEVVNTGIQQQHQQQRPPDDQQDQPDHSSHGSTPAAAAVPEDIEAPQLLTLSDLQAAARRDLCWLVLASDTLEQRLTELQQELGVSVVGLGTQRCCVTFMQQSTFLLWSCLGCRAEACLLDVC
jgi:hypothetical protein